MQAILRVFLVAPAGIHAQLGGPASVEQADGAVPWVRTAGLRELVWGVAELGCACAINQ